MRAPQLVQHPELAPCACFTCGTIGGPMIDTMVDHFDGRVYICVETCLAPMAALIGYAAEQPHIDETAELETVATMLEERLADAYARLEAYELILTPRAEPAAEAEPVKVPA